MLTRPEDPDDNLVQRRLRDPARLAALHEVALLDTAPEEAFDRVTRLASRLLGAPVTLISLLDDQRQFFKSGLGLSEPVASARETPLSHSFCQYVVASGAPFVVEDARVHPLVQDNPSVREMGVVAYAGVPLRAAGEHVLGSLCAVDDRPRRWTAEELASLQDLAAGVMTEIELRASEREAITERRRGEAERSRLQGVVDQEGATLAAIAESMSEGLVVLDAAGSIRFVNRRAGAFVGVDPRSLVGRRADEVFDVVRAALVAPEDARRRWRWALAAADELPVFEVDVASPRPRGVEVQLVPVVDRAGVRLGLGVTLRDVTAERELQRAKDELVSVVSHELRTPLTSVVGFAELLLTRDVGEAERRRFLEVILHEGQRLSTLVSNFLDMGRMESEAPALDRRATSVALLLEEARQAAGEDTDRPITLDVPAGLPPVLVDRDATQRVLAHLLANARKYSPPGGEVRLSACGGDGVVEIAVQDRGLGLSPEVLPRVFERFFRADNSDRRAIRGTGLGLTICRQVVEAHGGRIWATSPGLDLGSTFRLTLPIAGNGSATGADPATADAPKGGESCRPS